MKSQFFFALQVALLLLNSQLVSAAERTSVDLYCQTMVTSVIDTSQYVTKKKIPLEQLQRAEKDMSDLCLATPAMESKRISNMSGQEIAIVSCVGFAEGAYIAYQPKGAPDEPYSKQMARREFAFKACASNPKKFQDDIFRRGPDYATTQRY
ncbi:exported protein of unknown function [Paraburkholderia dioscoreae]|uniref:Uncharacterized protein n=2 Tax=Paraburkholderia dioscoreae TaxID=2604047 RepID=A0A5Q4Z281_9BURK|nr:exported protein of unknown function [Paraburkholderia dioscoreae]